MGGLCCYAVNQVERLANEEGALPYPALGIWGQLLDAARYSTLSNIDHLSSAHGGTAMRAHEGGRGFALPSGLAKAKLALK
jgi:hypothetical protein